jgi:site-specific recombinase XerD
MSDCSPTAIVPLRSDMTMLERLALVGFLAGYSGPTRDSYRTDLRLFSAWLALRQVRLLDVHRTHIELYGRWLEEQGRARSTIGRRLSTLAGFYRYCEQEQILERSPGRTSAVRSRTTSRAHSVWTATSSAPSWSPPGCRRTGTTPWRRCWH